MDIQTWLVGQIEACAPTRELAPGEVGRPIADLATVVNVLEGGGGTLFGMHASADTVAPLRPLAARARELLEAWRVRLMEIDPVEGPATLHTIAARQGITLATMEIHGIAERQGVTLETRTQSRAIDALDTPAPARSSAALAMLEATLRNAEALTALWREQNDLVEDDDVVYVSTGNPNRAELTSFVAHFEAFTGKRLPLFFARLIDTYNGLEIGSSEPEGDDQQYSLVDAPEFAEPLLWPVDKSWDPYVLANSDFAGISLAIVFGAVGDSGYFVFDPSARDDEDAPTFWIPRHFSSEAPVRLTDTIADFVTLLCECGLSGRQLLRKVRVPGWGAA